MTANLATNADSGIVSTPWSPGPRADLTGRVVVSFTDFRAVSEDDLKEVFETGMRLGQSWPIMHGAVGLWQWGKPAELRGGSVSVWETSDDLWRFVRWPVHTAIVRQWRNRIEVLTEIWEDESFDAEQVWARAEARMRVARELAAPGGTDDTR